MPSRSHRGVWGLLVAAVLAVLCAWGGTSLSPAPVLAAPHAAHPPAPALPDARAYAFPAGPAPGGAPAATAGTARAEDAGRAAGGRGGRCAPAQQGPDGTPGVPARAGSHAEHCVASASRPVPWGAAAPGAAPRAPAPVRAPGGPAPGPVELSVMRV